ncbi:hypothetical protein V6N12_058303 [Hibiscus sabdariffa]|uniref:Uncharacterized protein n=1 Tax=Hibiscus sabdariffa TaxID=183260 RepID=A0ABR2ERQ6_9ROSI
MEAKPLGSHMGGSIFTIEWKERLERRTREAVGAFPLYKFTHLSFYPLMHHHALYPWFKGIQSPMRPTFIDSSGTLMPLHSQTAYPPRGSTPLAPSYTSHIWIEGTPFVQPPNSHEEEAYYPILPSPH